MTGTSSLVLGAGASATEPLPHLLSFIAVATGGAFYPVEDAGDLHCALARSLVP
jgi:hypothetical protein